MTKSKILCILTNEAFIPSGGRGGHHPSSYDGNPIDSNRIEKDSPVVEYSASAWTSPSTAILDPPALFQEDHAKMFHSRHQKTGINIMELAHVWLKLVRNGNFDMVFTSPKGGSVPIDPLSVELLDKDEKITNILRQEKEFMLSINHTFPINWIHPKEYDAVFIPGSHGAMFDLPEHPDIANIISNIYADNGICATIGHGASALLNVRDPKKSHNYLIKDKRICCFSMPEEKHLGFEKYLPYCLEEKLRERGAKIENQRPMQSNVLIDDNIITAQNSSSLTDFIDKFIKKLQNN